MKFPESKYWRPMWVENKSSRIVWLFALLSLCIKSHLYSQEILPKGFVYLHDYLDTYQLDLRYYSTDNFMGYIADGYEKEVCITTKKTAKALKRANRKLKKRGLGFKLFDAYRPQQAVDHFAKWAGILSDTLTKAKYYPDVPKNELFDRGYIAYKSGHTRGSTVDVTLYHLESGKELDMGSGWDYFGKASWIAHEDLTKEQRANRAFLQHIMLTSGFKNYDKEWWHFTLKKEPFSNTYFNFPVK